LAASMQEHGQINPVLLTDDNVLVAGYRRFAAAGELGWDEIEYKRCVGDPGVINLIENMNRSGLSLWEEIQAIKRVFPDKTQAEIARALSKSKTWVKPRLRIWDLPQDFIDKVRAGQSGLKEIRQMLAPKRENAPVSTGVGVPKQQEIKEMVTWLMAEGRDVEATALSYACGAIDADYLKSVDYE
jgi:ParB family chromosome partitioning protein